MKQLHPRAVWLFFISVIFRFIVLGIFAGFWLLGFAGAVAPENFVASFLTIFFGIIIAVIVLSYIWAVLTYKFYRYELTDMGFRKEHGIIWKKYITIPYDRIQNVDIYRGLIARILGLSDIQIQTAGGISRGSYGAMSEGRLLGLSIEEANAVRDEVLLRARNSKHQGL